MPVKKIPKQMQNTVALMAANSATVSKIARETKLHHTSVKRLLADESVQKTRAELEEIIVSSFSDVCRRALDNISDEKLEKASPRDLGVLAGICIDKNRLMTGQSTMNVAVMYANAVIAAQADLDADMEPRDS